ncbi:MAG TPA: helix-turn-helix transcriptional regulator [Streptosporangiaceae bacterium]|jgi:DNA-binding transcriptional ArsR family regulator
MSVTPLSEAGEADIAPVAALMADHARAAMLTALLDGRPLAASELARLAAVSAPTASAHLAKLLDGGLVTVLRQGRHRYYRLAGPQVAAAIEALSQLAPRPVVRSLRQSRQAAALAEARTCYDHLAGRAGVTLLDLLLREGLLSEEGERGSGDLAALRYVVTRRGTARLEPFGINIDAIRASRRRFAWACLDWTQRRPHLGGALGAAITGRLFELGWIEHGTRLRSVRVTPAGEEGLAATFGWAGDAAAS